MRRDGHFSETYRFTNEYTGKPEGEGSSEGTWHDRGRDWLTRDLVLEHFVLLAGFQRKQGAGTANPTVLGYAGTTAIEVDPGSDIAFFKLTQP